MNPSTLSILQLFRKNGIKTRAYSELVAILTDPDFHAEEVAPSYYLASKVEEATIPTTVNHFIFSFIFISIFVLV